MMKRAILIISIILTGFLGLKAQFQYPIGTPTWYKKVRVDSVFWLNTVDTAHSYAILYPGALMSRLADTSLYISDGTKWIKVGKNAADLSGYVPTTRSINTTSPLSGGGNLSADRTLSIANAAADGTTKGAASFTASDFNSSSGNISIDYTNGQTASGSTKGFLTSTDWTTFINKVGSGESGIYKSGSNLRLGTNALVEDVNIPLAGHYLSITGNGTPLGTGGNAAYDFRHEHNQAGIVGMYTKNTNKSGAAIVTCIGDSTGVSGGMGFYGRTFTPAFENAYTQPGILQIVSGSQANGVTVRAINPNGEVKLGVDTMNVAVIGASTVVPGKRSIHIKPQIWPEGDLEIANVGNTIAPDSTIHGVTTGLVRFNWAAVLTWNNYLDVATGVWKRKVSHLPNSSIEVGKEGVTLHAQVPHTDMNSRLHELLQARSDGIDGGATGSGTDTGKFIQVKVPLAMRYTSTPYSSDNVSWEGGDLRPMLWLMSEETKLPEGEFARIEQTSATVGGGHLAFRKSRGTMNARTAGLSGDNAGFVDFYNYDGSNYVNGARITTVLEANASAGSSPTALRFDAGSSSGTLAERMRITSGGNLLINTTSNGGSRLQVKGPIATAIATVTGNTTLDATHSTVLVNNTGSVTISLPTAASVFADGVGRIYTIKKISAASNDVVIDPNGTELLDGSSASKTLTLQWSSITIQSNGTSWFVLASHASATTL